MKFFSSSMAVAFAVSLFPTVATAAMVIGVDVSDSQLTPNHSKGDGKSIPVYAFYKDENTVFKFNAHYSQMPIKWTLDVPAELQGTNYQVTSASVLMYQKANSGTWNPADGQIKLFATGFSGDSGKTAAGWNESFGYYGPSVSSATPLQDPYLIELGTNARAEDNLAATPWAVGQIDPSYDGSTVPTEAVPIRFYFDVNNPQIRTKLKDGLEAGFTMFTLASTFQAAQPGGPAVDYPQIVTREGVSDPAYGTIQKAPTLTIEVSPQASARDWHLY